MARPIRISAILYRALLLLYPSRLRLSYAEEMLWVFEQQLENARGARKVARIWWLVLRDLVTIAIPAQIADGPLIPVAVSGVVTPAIFMFLITVMQDLAFARWIDYKFLFGGQ